MAKENNLGPSHAWGMMLSSMMIAHLRGARIYISGVRDRLMHMIEIDMEIINEPFQQLVIISRPAISYMYINQRRVSKFLIWS